MPPIVTPLPPTANLAVGDRGWIDLLTLCVPNELDQSTADQTVVGVEVGEPKRLPRKALSRLHHVHARRLPPLDHPQQVGIQAQLQDRPTPRLLRQLGVDDVVGPITQVAGFVDPDQDVGVAVEASIAQVGLDDDVGARASGFEGASVVVLASELAQIDDAQRALAEMIDVGLLVVDAALLQQLERRVTPDGFLELADPDQAIEPSQVLAGQMVGEVGGGESGSVHRSSCSAAWGLL